MKKKKRLLKKTTKNYRKKLKIEDKLKKNYKKKENNKKKDNDKLSEKTNIKQQYSSSKILNDDVY